MVAFAVKLPSVVAEKNDTLPPRSSPLSPALLASSSPWVWVFSAAWRRARYSLCCSQCLQNSALDVRGGFGCSTLALHCCRLVAIACGWQLPHRYTNEACFGCRDAAAAAAAAAVVAAAADVVVVVVDVVDVVVVAGGGGDGVLPCCGSCTQSQMSIVVRRRSCLDHRDPAGPPDGGRGDAGRGTQGCGAEESRSSLAHLRQYSEN